MLSWITFDFKKMNEIHYIEDGRDPEWFRTMIGVEDAFEELSRLHQNEVLQTLNAMLWDCTEANKRRIINALHSQSQ